MAARMLRLHMPDGKVDVEPLLRTARGNGLTGVAAALRLVAEWEKRGYIVRRTDGGYTVLKVRPRPDTATVRSMIFANALDDRGPAD